MNPPPYYCLKREKGKRRMGREMDGWTGGEGDHDDEYVMNEQSTNRIDQLGMF